MHTFDTNAILYYLKGDTEAVNTIDAVLNQGFLADSDGATALFTGSMLITRNTRDFNKVPNLSLLKI